MGDKTVKRIIFFASGSGTNVENIIKYFHGNRAVEITLILTNNPNAGVVRRAEKLMKPLMLFSKRELLDQSLLRKIVKILEIQRYLIWLVYSMILAPALKYMIP